MGEELWIFKRNKIYITNKQDFKHRLEKYIKILALSDLSSKCSSKLLDLDNVSIIEIIYDKFSKPFSLENNETNFETRLITSKLCTSSSLDFIISNVAFFTFMRYHLGILYFIVILIFLIWPLSIFIFFLRMRKENSYIVDENQDRNQTAEINQSSSRVGSEEEVTAINLPIKCLRSVGSRCSRLMGSIKKADQSQKSYFYSPSSKSRKSENETSTNAKEQKVKPNDNDQQQQFSERNVD